MPAPALRTRLGRGCQATPRRGAKLSFRGCHKGVPGGANVMVARLSTPITVNGRSPMGAEGAVLYSHRRPYVIVSVRATFHVSWTKMLQLDKVSSTSPSLLAINASGSVLVRTSDSEGKRYCTEYGANPVCGLRRRKSRPVLIRCSPTTLERLSVTLICCWRLSPKVPAKSRGTPEPASKRKPELCGAANDGYGYSTESAGMSAPPKLS